jgi:hypothetical protein
MSEFVEDTRISVEQLIKKIKPPDPIRTNGKRMVSLTKEEGYKELKIKEPKIAVSKGKLHM